MTKNVFALCTGRCGSTTFAKASKHISNFTAGHETRTRLIGADRLDYPVNHIEADNRLSWMLGRLQDRWGDDAYYVHLTRDRMATAESFSKRARKGILRAYRGSILLGKNQNVTDLEYCGDFVDNVTANIKHYLSDKTNVLPMKLENAGSDYAQFWDWIGAEGDKDAALAEWGVKHNYSR